MLQTHVRKQEQSQKNNEKNKVVFLILSHMIYFIYNYIYNCNHYQVIFIRCNLQWVFSSWVIVLLWLSCINKTLIQLLDLSLVPACPHFLLVLDRPTFLVLLILLPVFVSSFSAYAGTWSCSGICVAQSSWNNKNMNDWVCI